MRSVHRSVILPTLATSLCQVCLLYCISTLPQTHTHLDSTAGPYLLSHTLCSCLFTSSYTTAVSQLVQPEACTTGNSESAAAVDQDLDLVISRPWEIHPCCWVIATSYHYYYKDRKWDQEFVSDAARDAYVINWRHWRHAVNLACSHRLAGCWPTRGSLAAGRGTSIGLQHVSDDLSVQRDKPRQV